MRKFFPACLLPLLAGCCGGAYRPDVHLAASPSPPPVGVVFVANGSGDFRTVCSSLRRVVATTSTPLQIETFAWSHGYGRYLIDHLDHAHHLIQGRRLATQVVAHHRACPERRTYLIGHSAGSAVVLAAAELLPPDSVERIILLAPSVCAEYDLRPALRTARLGVDVFHSSQDNVILGVGTWIVGTADHGCRTAAGMYGFTPVIACPSDATLYGKLHQHPWDPVIEWSGHHGGHYGNNQAIFLWAYVLPLLNGN